MKNVKTEGCTNKQKVAHKAASTGRKFRTKEIRNYQSARQTEGTAQAEGSSRRPEDSVSRRIFIVKSLANHQEVDDSEGSPKGSPEGSPDGSPQRSPRVNLKVRQTFRQKNWLSASPKVQKEMFVNSDQTVREQ